MKTLTLLLVITFIFTSCSKNCDEEKSMAAIQYQKSVSYTNGSVSALKKLKAEYEKKIADIDKNCN